MPTARACGVGVASALRAYRLEAPTVFGRILRMNIRSCCVQRACLWLIAYGTCHACPAGLLLNQKSVLM